MDVEIDERLAVLETKIDTLLERESTAGHEKRIIALERWRSFLLGAWAVLGLLAGWLLRPK